MAISCTAQNEDHRFCKAFR